MSTDQPRARNAYLVWGVGVAAYMIAVAHRSSFGVAGIDATERFGITAAVLSLFTVVQLAVYAGAQIPVGMLLDRIGSQRMIAIGAIVMALGQVGMVLAQTTSMALAARLLLGAGDAMTFVSVIRLVPQWFPARRVPVLTQFTGILGQLGQVISAIPFVLVLHKFGWNVAFSGLAILGVFAAVAVFLWVRDSPEVAGAAVVEAESTAPATGESPAKHVPAKLDTDRPAELGDVSAFRNPGTWLGFWSHMVTSFSLNVFTLLWGYPFLVVGQGLSPAQASALLTLTVIVGIIAGPLLGEFTARHPLRRSWAVLAIGLGVGAGWAMVLIPSTPRPMWILAIFAMLIAVGGPGSVIGFDFARTFNPAHRLGTATGLVNIGGFSAAVVAIFLVGLVLDKVNPTGNYTLDNFRIALSVVLIPWILSMVGVLVTRARTRAEMAENGVIVPPLSEVWIRFRGVKKD